MTKETERIVGHLMGLSEGTRLELSYGRCQKQKALNCGVHVIQYRVVLRNGGRMKQCIFPHCPVRRVARNARSYDTGAHAWSDSQAPSPSASSPLALSHVLKVHLRAGTGSKALLRSFPSVTDMNEYVWQIGRLEKFARKRELDEAEVFSDMKKRRGKEISYVSSKQLTAPCLFFIFCCFL